MNSRDLELMMSSLGLTGNDMQRMANEMFGSPPPGARAVRSPSSDTGDAAIRMFEAARRQAEEDRRLGPGPCPPVHRRSFIEHMIQSRAQMDEMAADDRGMMLQTYVGHERHSSSTPLSSLIKIPFSEMQARRVHTGRYLLCRLATLPSRMIAVQLCAEDPADDVRLLSVYNYPGTRMAIGKVLDTMFPMGAVLAIREPMMKLGANDGRAMIRVDSPSDIVFINPSDSILRGVAWKHSIRVSKPTPRTANEWKDLGNVHFKASQYLAAAVAYSNGLETDPNAYILRLNRAAAYLRLEHFSAALDDATAVLARTPLPVDEEIKARFRVAQAEYGLGKYEAAVTELKACLSLSPNLAELSAWFARCRDRIRESEGRYDWVQMFRDAQIPKRRLDIAEYLGPIKVQPILQRGGGRGVVATRAIKAGELLLVAKPFAASFPDELAKGNFVFAMNFITSIRESPCTSEALSQVFEKIVVDPALAPLIFGLYAGPNYPDPPSEYPPSISTGTRLHNPRIHELDLDTQRIENIYTYNAFNPSALEDDASMARKDTDTPPSALYLLPSLFNHACSGSATWFNFRNVMVIRTTKDLSEGEEITLPYAGGATYLDRQKVLKKHMKICDCWLCDADRKDGEAACRRRKELLARFDSPAPDRDMSVPATRAFLRDMEATYSTTRGPLRPASAKAHHELATAFVIKMQRDPSFGPQGISENIAALECLGVVVQDSGIAGSGESTKDNTTALPIATDIKTPILHPDFCVGVSLMISATFLRLREVQRAKNWIKASFWLESISAGGGWELFRLRRKQTLQDLSLLEFAQSVAAETPDIY
ncbi:hypothetical protein BOTBODRAFT_302161 [Botryobasidium botryosum FD-172 SS1]|uniref:SET domain-containing protein n=1 Tax=Botryobasidium botryosum (strain FD-172 SS1) TaxID=930990 RepID=A0A067MK50_BOTB1|nr:hypothetical protein BOTBODRAFT_302161 [Botryobasidium botryosum FD-172 SS1]